MIARNRAGRQQAWEPSGEGAACRKGEPLQAKKEPGRRRQAPVRAALPLRAAASHLSSSDSDFDLLQMGVRSRSVSLSLLHLSLSLLVHSLSCSWLSSPGLQVFVWRAREVKHSAREAKHSASISWHRARGRGQTTTSTCLPSFAAAHGVVQHAHGRCDTHNIDTHKIDIGSGRNPREAGSGSAQHKKA